MGDIENQRFVLPRSGGPNGGVIRSVPHIIGNILTGFGPDVYTGYSLAKYAYHKVKSAMSTTPYSAPVFREVSSRKRRAIPFLGKLKPRKRVKISSLGPAFKVGGSRIKKMRYSKRKRSVYNGRTSKRFKKLSRAVSRIPRMPTVTHRTLLSGVIGSDINSVGRKEIVMNRDTLLSITDETEIPMVYWNYTSNIFEVVRHNWLANTVAATLATEMQLCDVIIKNLRYHFTIRNNGNSPCDLSICFVKPKNSTTAISHSPLDSFKQGIRKATQGGTGAGMTETEALDDPRYGYYDSKQFVNEWKKSRDINMRLEPGAEYSFVWSPKKYMKLHYNDLHTISGNATGFWSKKFGAGAVLFKTRGVVCHQATVDSTPSTAGYANTILDYVVHRSAEICAVSPAAAQYLDKDGALGTITAPSMNTAVGPQVQTLPVDPTP